MSAEETRAQKLKALKMAVLSLVYITHTHVQAFRVCIVHVFGALVTSTRPPKLFMFICSCVSVCLPQVGTPAYQPTVDAMTDKASWYVFFSSGSLTCVLSRPCVPIGDRNVLMTQLKRIVGNGQTAEFVTVFQESLPLVYPPKSKAVPCPCPHPPLSSAWLPSVIAACTPLYFHGLGVMHTPL
jgi:hypothetical protein